jgi:hypothetical protein
VRPLARRVAGDVVGVLPWFDYRLKITRVADAWRLLLFERREARALAKQLPSLPRARVVTIIPTYRRPDALIEAIRSALAQTVEDHAVLVVDDGAGLPPLPDDARLTAVSLSRNCGVVGVVRNVGIRLSRSEVLAFLDDDNTWSEEHLEAALAAHARGVPLTYSGLERVTDTGAPVDILARTFVRRDLKEHGFVDASTIVVRRGRGTFFSRTPRRFGDFPREDWEFAWRLSRRRRVELVPNITVRYVIHRESHFTDWSSEVPASDTNGGR